MGVFMVYSMPYFILIVVSTVVLAMLWYAYSQLRNAYANLRANSHLHNKPLPPLKSYPTVAIIVPARNEAQHIAECILSITLQTYPTQYYELIVIDDASTDATASIVQESIAQHPHCTIRLIQLPEDPTTIARKKAALAAGIAATQAQIILTTDADCVMPPTWLTTMVKTFAPDGDRIEAAVVAGPVRLKRTGNFWVELQALEHIGLIALAAGGIARGNPVLCNGGNFGFLRAAYSHVGGYSGIDNRASGDDLFLLEKMVQAGYVVRFAVHSAAVVQTEACHSLHAFVNQRIRWVSKSAGYRNWGLKAHLFVCYWAVLGLVVLYCGIPYWGWGLPVALSVVKLIADTALTLSIRTIIPLQGLGKYFVFIQPFHILYVAWVGLVGNVSKTYTWKDRIVR